MLLKEICDQRFNFFWDINQTKYVYDLNGNLTSKQEKGLSGKVWNYIYSSENQLVQADFYEGSVKLKSLEFSYDPQGRRIRKYVHDLQANTEFERRYAYDGSEIIAELDESNNVLARYTHSGLRTDDVLSVEITSSGVSRGLATSAGDYFYLKDGLGSVQAIADSAGNIIQRYVYSSFGKILKITDGGGLETSSVIKTSYTFTNREWDEESGLYYYRARYYDAHNGRFMQEDSHAGFTVDPITFNTKYSYASNNAINFIDPTGLFTIKFNARKAFKNISRETTKAWDSAVKIATSREAQLAYATLGAVGLVVLSGGAGAVVAAMGYSAAAGLAAGAGYAYLNDKQNVLGFGIITASYAAAITLGAAGGMAVGGAAASYFGISSTIAKGALIFGAGMLGAGAASSGVDALLGNDEAKALGGISSIGGGAGSVFSGSGVGASAGGGHGGAVYIPSSN